MQRLTSLEPRDYPVVFCNKKSGVNERQTEKDIKFPKTTRFI